MHLQDLLSWLWLMPAFALLALLVMPIIWTSRYLRYVRMRRQFFLMHGNAARPLMVSFLFLSMVMPTLAQTAPAPAASAPAALPITWQCDFNGTRAGRYDGAIWAYCFGDDGVKVYVKQRVIMISGITAGMIADASSWARTGKPDLWEFASSEAIWNSPDAAPARAMMWAAIQDERKAGTMPKIPVWVVAPNPASSTVPPTRPMFLAADPGKTVKERATVGAVCACAAQVIKGTQTLCPLKQSDPANLPSSNLTACVRQ